MQYLKNKNGEIEAIRHGELALLPIDKKPTKMRKTASILNVGSHGHPHSVINGTFYVLADGENIIGYLVAQKDCYLTHEEHGDQKISNSLKRADIPRGVYEVRTQVQDTHEGMQVVID